MRSISKEQAAAVRQILVEECGLQPDDGRDGFVYNVAHAEHPSREYRFCGALGFGGKFRNNGNRNNTPHVDCYRDHETPERLAMIENANRRLSELFHANA
jgi:hypothetical protein